MKIKLLVLILLVTTMVMPAPAFAAGTSSLTVDGTSVNVSGSAGDLASDNWLYDLNTLTLKGFGDGAQAQKPDIKAVGALDIFAADYNHIKTLDVSGMIRINGSGVIVIDELKNLQGLEIDGAAVFLKSGGSYILLNDASVYDWATLSAGEFVIPSGMTIELPTKMSPDDPDLLVSTAILTISAGSSLVIEDGGTMVIDGFQQTPYFFLSKLDVKGKLQILDGGLIENHGHVTALGGGIIESIGSGAIDSSTGNRNDGTITLKAGNSGSTPLALNMVNGLLKLYAANGSFSGGISMIRPQGGSRPINIYGNGDSGKVVAMDYLRVPSGDLAISGSSNILNDLETTGLDNANSAFHMIGQLLSISGDFECAGTLSLESLDMYVGGDIKASELYINASNLVCEGTITADTFASSFTTMNLGAMSAMNQNHTNIFTNLVTPNPVFQNVISRSYANYLLRSPSTRLEGLQGGTLTGNVNFVWNGSSTLTYDTLYNSAKDIFDVEVAISPPPKDTSDILPLFPTDEEPVVEDNIYSLLYFVVLGKDSGGKSQIWYIYPELQLAEENPASYKIPATQAQDVKEIFAIQAVNYFSSGVFYDTIRPGHENSVYSDHTGSGAVGNGTSVSLCGLGVHYYSGATCTGCGAENPGYIPPQDVPKTTPPSTPNSGETPRQTTTTAPSTSSTTSTTLGSGSTQDGAVDSGNVDNGAPIEGPDVAGASSKDSKPGTKTPIPPLVLLPVAGGGVGAAIVVLKIILKTSFFGLSK